MLMKSRTPSRLEITARLTRGLIKRRLVLARKLPEGAGKALVLATAGVRLLAEHGISAVSGKNFGDTQGVCWMPPANWKHDLLAHGVLCKLFTQGYTVISEAAIPRKGVAKLPDGLVLSPGEQGHWYWLEVENARKSGPHMRHLATAMDAVSRAETKFGDITPKRCMVAYFADAIDERNHRLNHRARIIKAVAEAAHNDLTITFAECGRKGAAGVGDVQLTEVLIVPKCASEILQKLETNGRSGNPKDDVWESHFDSYIAYVWDNGEEHGLWGYQVEDNGKRIPAGYASDLNDGKKLAAALISKLIASKN